jgi:hypothetical protein
MVHLWYKQGILYKGVCGALAALVSRREGALVGASGVGRLRVSKGLLSQNTFEPRTSSALHVDFFGDISTGGVN